MTMPKLLKIHEVATLFRVSTRTIYSWIDIGAINGIRIKGTYRFNEDEIKKLLNKNNLKNDEN